MSVSNKQEEKEACNKETVYAVETPDAKFIKIDKNRKNKIIAMISYVPFLWCFGLVLGDIENDVLRHHINQGIVLNVCSFCGFVIVSIFDYFVSEFLKSALFFSVFLSLLLQGLLLVFILIGMYNAYRQNIKFIPWIGSLFTFL